MGADLGAGADRRVHGSAPMGRCSRQPLRRWCGAGVPALPGQHQVQDPRPAQRPNRRRAADLFFFANSLFGEVDCRRAAGLEPAVVTKMRLFLVTGVTDETADGQAKFTSVRIDRLFFSDRQAIFFSDRQAIFFGSTSYFFPGGQAIFFSDRQAIFFRIDKLFLLLRIDKLFL